MVPANARYGGGHAEVMHGNLNSAAIVLPRNFEVMEMTVVERGN